MGAIFFLQVSKQAIGSLGLAKIRPRHLNTLYSDLKENGIRADTDRAVATQGLKTTLHEMEISKAKLAWTRFWQR